MALADDNDGEHDEVDEDEDDDDDDDEQAVRDDDEYEEVDIDAWWWINPLGDGREDVEWCLWFINFLAQNGSLCSTMAVLRLIIFLILCSKSYGLGFGSNSAAGKREKKDKMDG